MLRDFNDALFRRLIAAFPPDAPYGPEALRQEAMPRPVAHFLTHMLEQRAAREAEQYPGNPPEWFDHAHREVREAHAAFTQALARHTHIPAAAWPDALARAVERVTAYLVRPAPTFSAFVFEESRAPRPVPEVLQQFDAFTAYPYLQEVARAYFEQKQIRTIDHERLTSLLQRVDREMTRGYGPHEWLRLLDPLFALAYTAFDRADGIPTALLTAFFEEKAFPEAERRLHAALEQQGRATLDEAALLHLLERPVEQPIAPPAAAPSPRTEPPARPQTAPAADESLPLWKRFQQTSPAPTTPPPRPIPSRPAPAKPSPPQVPARREDVPLWMQFRSAVTPPPNEPEAGAPDLLAVERQVLGENGPKNRMLFVKHLFAGSQEDYERVLRRLQTAVSWTQASQIIAQDVFRKNQVNIYSDPAIAFTDAVQNQYRR